MLRICVTDGPTELKFVLEGDLIEPWVSELKTLWEAERKAEAPRRCVVDLKDVTRVDGSGKGLLASMKCHGVDFVAKGVSTKYMIRCLGEKDARN